MQAYGRTLGTFRCTRHLVEGVGLRWRERGGRCGACLAAEICGHGSFMAGPEQHPFIASCSGRLMAKRHCCRLCCQGGWRGLCGGRLCTAGCAPATTHPVPRSGVLLFLVRRCVWGGAAELTPPRVNRGCCWSQVSGTTVSAGMWQRQVRPTGRFCACSIT